MDLLGGTLLSQMNLPRRMELIQATLMMDLQQKMESRTGAIQDSVGKSFKFKLKSMEHTAFL